MTVNGYVALTFDDGPSDTFPQLLEALTDHRLQATFFNQGNNSVARPDSVRDQVDAGMWVGNHSFSHPHLTDLSEPEAVEEIARTQGPLRNITGAAPALFRPPYGATSEQVRAYAARFGLVEVLWTVDSRDWDGASVEEIVAAAASMGEGDIILMHDWPANTVASIPRIAQVLAEKGLRSGEIGLAADPTGGTTVRPVAGPSQGANSEKR